MKKILLIATLAAGLSGVTAFGQGYFSFSGATRGVWDDWSQGTARLAQTNNVAFLVGSGTPSVSTIMSSVPTNNATGYSYATAWADILGDSTFMLATNANALGAPVVQLCGGNGAWSYAPGGNSTFPVAGTAAQAYTVYVIGWNANYATPQAAQTAGAAVGWSSTFTYTAVNSIGTPSSMSTSGLVPFGVGAVPEPSTFALAGLGAAALMIFRRKK